MIQKDKNSRLSFTLSICLIQLNKYIFFLSIPWLFRCWHIKPCYSIKHPLRNLQIYLILNYIYIYIYRVERWNCRSRKDDMILFPFDESQFYFFVADHLLVGQLCTNPKRVRTLLLCLKVTQCSTSEIGDAPLYNSCSHPQNANLDYHG